MAKYRGSGILITRNNPMILFVTYSLKRYLYYFSIIFGYDPNVGSSCFGYIVTQVMVLLDKWQTADTPS